MVQTPGRCCVAGVTYVLLSPSPYRQGLTKLQVKLMVALGTRVSLVTSQTRMRTLIDHTAGQRLTYKPLITGGMSR